MSSPLPAPIEMFLETLAEFEKFFEPSGEFPDGRWMPDEHFTNFLHAFMAKYHPMYLDGWRLISDLKGFDPENENTHGIFRSAFEEDAFYCFNELYSEYCRKPQKNVTSFLYAKEKIKRNLMNKKQEDIIGINNSYRKNIVDFVTYDANDEEINEIIRLKAFLLLKRKRDTGQLPKWGAFDNPDNLKNLTAPLFLKEVFGSLAVGDTLDKSAIRELDSSLMADVEQYISRRISRGKDMGDAAGLKFNTTRSQKRVAVSADPQSGKDAPIHKIA